MIGSLKHKMLLQQGISTPIDGGGYINNFENIKEIMADIMPLRSKELIVAMGAQIHVSHKIKIRYELCVKPNMRFFYKGRYFKIQTIMNEKEQDRFLLLYCIEEYIDS